MDSCLVDILSIDQMATLEKEIIRLEQRKISPASPEYVHALRNILRNWHGALHRNGYDSDHLAHQIAELMKETHT